MIGSGGGGGGGGGGGADNFGASTHLLSFMLIDSIGIWKPLSFLILF
jgi:hypothetical protein